MHMSAFVIDDDKAITRFFSDIIRKMDRDVEVRVFNNSIEASKAIDLDRPNVVILDLSMPGIDGCEILKNNITEGTVALVFSGLDLTPERESELIYSGATWVIHKPAPVRQMQAYIWRAFKQAESLRLLKHATKLSGNVRKRMKKALSDLKNTTSSDGTNILSKESEHAHVVT